MADNKLFYGDNLDVLRRYIKDETVDLIDMDLIKEGAKAGSAEQLALE